MNPQAPHWLTKLAQAAISLPASEFSLRTPRIGGGRESAVLILFGEGPDGPDVLLTQRSAELRDHAGQAAFPGGAVDPDDDGPADTALREAKEETGLDPSGVDVLGNLAALWLEPSGFLVVPVIGWWREPCAVAPGDPAEVAAVARVPIAALADPANRFRVRHRNGFVGPAFDVGELFVWGFTAGILDRLLAIGGWALPWDRGDVRERPL